jgi:hypothetical protein
MAKALFGHVGNDLDVRMASELRRMRDRVRELEGEVARLNAANDALSSKLMDEMLTLSIADRDESVPERVGAQREPALT